MADSSGRAPPTAIEVHRQRELARELQVARAGFFQFIVMTRAIKNDLRMNRDFAEQVVGRCVFFADAIRGDTQPELIAMAVHYVDWEYGRNHRADDIPTWLPPNTFPIARKI